MIQLRLGRKFVARARSTEASQGEVFGVGCSVLGVGTGEPQETRETPKERWRGVGRLLASGWQVVWDRKPREASLRAGTP